VSDGTINQSISATQVRAALADAPSLEAKPSAPGAGGMGNTCRLCRAADDWFY
jgi:hypothetical protein